MHKFRIHRTLVAALVLLLITVPGQARRLMELDGIELRGTARVLTYGAATCHVLEEKYSAEDYERLKDNEGQPLDLWQLDFSIYNGSGKALDHLIARYGIEAEWPPCTNWSEMVEYPGPVSWADEAGSIQRGGTTQVVAPGETVTKKIYIISFHTDEPRFARWSVDYTFAEGTHAAPDKQPAQAEVQPPAAQPAQAATLPPVPILPTGISAGDTCVGKAEGSLCWMELENQPGCHVWNGNLQPDETVTWSAGCADGLAEGDGTVTWRYGDGKSETNTGRLQTGKMHGHWVLRLANGGVQEGSFVHGKKHGHWILRTALGGVQEGPIVDGKKHGHWVLRFFYGEVHEGSYVDDKQHGRWIGRTAEGRIFETIWEYGKEVDFREIGDTK